MTNKEIRTALLKSGTRFTLKTKFSMNDGVEFEMNRFNERYDWEPVGSGMSVRSRNSMFDSMNVERIGTRQMVLYTFTMMGRKIKETVKFDDINIVRVGL